MISRLLKGYRAWERPARIALLSALGLLALDSLVLSVGPESIRLPGVIGFAGLLIVIQLIVMWANRGMVTPYTRAQRLYLDGDLAGAVALLEPLRADKTAFARDLTLLGNTYRQLGRLDESEQVLLEALDKAPQDYFPIYGFGRTLLSQGRYAEAAEAIRRALELGAPQAVRADLGEAFYRDGDTRAAREALEAVQPDSDPARALMARYLLYRLGAAEAPSQAAVTAGLAYWQATAARFAQTAYGQSLAEDVGWMQMRVKE